MYHDGEENDEAQTCAGTRRMGCSEGDSVRGGVDDEAEGCGEGSLLGILAV